MIHSSIKYAKDVIAGKVPACRWAKLTYQRHLDNIDDVESGRRTDIWFDEKAADHTLDFFSRLKLWKGREYKGREFVLAPHFQFITSCIMGWRRTDNNARRFRTAYIEMGRKGAKSTYAGGLGGYFFVEDGEHGAELYTAAVKEKQAKIVWTNIQNLLKTSIFSEMITYYKENMSIEDTWSKCEFVVGDPRGLDGLDSHFVSLDELHAHPTADVHDLMNDSFGTRAQPLMLIITTAGFDQSGVCYQRREYLTKILKGIIEDDSFFGIIYTLDVKKDWPKLLTAQEKRSGKKGILEDDPLNDESCWVKANPGLCGNNEEGLHNSIDENGRPTGYMTKIEDIRDKARIAKEIISAQNNFLTKRMNIWTQTYSRWLDLELWDANRTKDIYVFD